MAEPITLYELKRAMALRRRDKMRAANAQWRLNGNRTAANWLELMRAQEASRGSKIRARRLHEKWQAAVAVVYGEARAVRP